jgi:kynurenine formamidase
MTTVQDRTNAATVPAYCDLAVFDGSEERHSWEVWGVGDELGTLNHLTRDRVAAAAREVVTGERISLQLPPGLPDPPLYGREPLRHEIFQTGRNNWDDRLDAFYPQRSSHWDGFRHVRFREHGFYGGLTADPHRLGERLGVHHWAQAGIIGRGVLLDLDSWLSARGDYDPFEGRMIEADELRAAAEDQGVEVRPGDIVCVRTGWTRRYRALDARAREELAQAGGRPAFSGLSASAATAELFWDWQVSAVAADNPAVEAAPGDPSVGSLHRRVLVQLGIPLGELFDLDELGRCCAEDGRWSFQLVSVPLAVVGGVGSPANAVAVR